MTHTNICGPMSYTSNGDQRYIKGFLDHYTIKSQNWAFYAKSKKDESLEKLIYFMIGQEYTHTFETTSLAPISNARTLRNRNQYAFRKCWFFFIHRHH